MNHVAIDLGGRESQICVRAGDGQVLQEERRPTLGLQKYLAKLEPAKVVVETCAEAFMVAEWARSAGHHVTVVPASLVRALGVGSRGIKNDVRDARNLSEASCRMQRLPSPHSSRRFPRTEVPVYFARFSRDVTDQADQQRARMAARTGDWTSRARKRRFVHAAPSCSMAREDRRRPATSASEAGAEHRCSDGADAPRRSRNFRISRAATPLASD
jgi:hypothetical protein